jgi:CBS domain-containing protein
MLIVADILKAKGTAVFSIDPGITVYDALKIMGEKNIGALPVTEAGKLTGIISERDYARKVVLKGRTSKDTLVSAIMTTEVITVSPSDSVEQCMNLMTGKKIRHLPVVENGALSGIISIGDVVMSIISTQKETIEHLQNYIAGS